MSGIIRRPLIAVRDVMTDPVNRVHLSDDQLSRVDELLAKEVPTKEEKSELNFYFGVVMDKCDD